MSKKKKLKRDDKNRPSQPSQRGKRAKRGAATARDRIRTEEVLVTDPYDAGRSCRATRTVDTITLLYRRGQIDAPQYRAADTYRHAAEICGGGLRCALDQSVVRGNSDYSPTEAQLRAAGVLSDASRILGMIDGRIVTMIVVDGYTIEQCAAGFFGVAPGGKPKRSDSEHIGRRLRLALETLADSWWPARGRRNAGAQLR